MDSKLHRKIAERAYAYFLERGGQHGYHIQDWNRAEKEILAESKKKKTATKKKTTSKKKTTKKTAAKTKKSTTKKASTKKSKK